MTETARIYLVDTGDEIVETTIRPEDDEWVLPKTAAKILCSTTSTINSMFAPGNNYFEVRRELRGPNGKESARGQGHLFNAEDLRRIVQIRQAVRCTTKAAARFFAAERLGKL